MPGTFVPFLLALTTSVAFAASPFTVFVSNERSGDITVIDPETNTVVRTIAAGQRPRGIHVGTRTGHLYVALSGSPRLGPGADPERAKSLVADKSADGIAIIDPDSGKTLRTLRVGSDPEQFAIDASETILAVANEDIAEVSLWNIATGKNSARLSVSEEPEGVAFHPRRPIVYVTSEARGELFIFDAVSGRQRARLAIGGRPRSVTFLPDGSRAYVPAEGEAAVTVIDATEQRLLQKISVPGDGVLPMGSVITPDGGTLFVSTGRGDSVAVIDTASNTTVATIAVGRRPWGLALSPDGSTLYSANGASDDLSVIDVATRRELTRVKTGAGPWGIAIVPR